MRHMTRFNRSTVSREFREGIKKAFPGLEEIVEFWALMGHLIFGRKCKYTGYPLIDSFHLAKIENKVYKLKKSKKYVGKTFLQRFQQEVMSLEIFTWFDWDRYNGIARTAKVIFSEEINVLINKELINNSEDRVFFVTGKKVTRAQAIAQREIIKLEADTYFEFAIPETRPLLKYMNNLPIHSFSKIVDKNWNAAWLKATEIQDPLKFRVQVEVLMTLREDLQPFYKPSQKGCTPRIFPCNYSIPMLRRDIRKTLTQGWYEFDLANSQLAIVSKEWDIPLVQNFLSTKQSIWPELFKHFNLSNLKVTNNIKYQGIKAIFKTSLYSLIYGMPKGNLVREINQGLSIYGINQGGKHYFNHHLIQALYKARELKFQEMNELEEVTTIFGRTIEIEGSKTLKGKATQQRKDSIASILAHQAQAIELYLLLPVVELASTTKDFYITLWQHDGFSVHFTDKTKIDRWISRILQVVQTKIDEQGILTHLEWELL